MIGVALIVPIAVIGGLLLIMVVLVSRGREGLDVSSRSVLRSYLYVGSFAGAVALAYGLASLLAAGIAAAAGNEFAYGEIPQDIAVRRAQELDAQRAQDALRGLTFIAAGGLFWLVHWLARNRVAPGDQGPLRHAYALLGTGIFATATIVLLPLGLYQGLSYWLLPAVGYNRPGAGGVLAGGIVALAVWLLYLRLVLDDMPRPPRPQYFRGPATPPEGAPVGARIGPPPSDRSAGAEAVPPRERDDRERR